MKIGVYIQDKLLIKDNRLVLLLEELKAAKIKLYFINNVVENNTDLVLCVGGDGTFLSASKLVASSGIPLFGVNLGRLGFLSENETQNALQAILNGQYTIENMDMLKVDVKGARISGLADFWPYAINEVTVHRKEAEVMGIKVSIDGINLPTYWADGLIVATSSGSTAYSLSAGGPICLPNTKVILVVPISPHNLNVRPLVVPITSKITISVIVRHGVATMTMDNRAFEIDNSCILNVNVADLSLKKVRLHNSNFVKALTSKLFWGEDIRNNSK